MMKRNLLAVVLSLIAGSANADWDLLGDAGRYVLYLDISKLKATGKLARIWKLADFKEAQSIGGITYRSDIALWEFDCENERWRTVSYIWYAGQMGNGSVLYSNTDGTNWSPIAPGTIAAIVSRTACLAVR